MTVSAAKLLKPLISKVFSLIGTWSKKSSKFQGADELSEQVKKRSRSGAAARLFYKVQAAQMPIKLELCSERVPRGAKVGKTELCPLYEQRKS